MKASSCPNLNRETTSFPNFSTLFQHPDHHHDTTLNKLPKFGHCDDTTLNKSPKTNDTGPSETSPFKGILSTSLSVNETNENHYRIVGFFPEWDQKDRTLPKGPPSPNGSDSSVSVGSNQFSGNGGARLLRVENLSKAWCDLMRKQRHLDDLTAQVGELRKENMHIITSVSVVTQQLLNVEGENSMLRTQVVELSHRLQSLNEIVSFMNMSGGGNGLLGTEEPYCSVSVDGFVNNCTAYNCTSYRGATIKGNQKISFYEFAACCKFPV